MFVDKEADVDWDLLLGIKNAGTLTELQQADKNQDKAQCDQLLAEAENHLAKVCGFKVNKDDSRADVENLMFLFEFTQALLESKVRQLDDTKAQLVYTQRLKSELDADRHQLREKVSEMTLREEEREADHDDLISEVSEKVKKLLAEKAEKAKQLKEREVELREADARIQELEHRLADEEDTKMAKEKTELKLVKEVLELNEKV